MPIDTSAFDDITRRILAAAIEVHRTLGPGLLESTYMPCFEDEMIVQKLDFVRGCAVPIIYKGKSLGQTYFVDLFVEKKVVVEVKCVSALLPVHHSQTLTYMRLLNAPAGLLINFNVPKLMDGVKRLINPRVLVGSVQ